MPERPALLGNDAPRIASVDASAPSIVIASPELPRHPDGLIRDPAPRPVAVDVPDLTDLRKRFDEARDLTADARKKQAKDRDYYDGPKQLDSDVRATLRMRGQPAIYTNRVRPAIDGILGVLEAGRVDPRAYPRNPTDEDAADVATKTLRYIADVAGFAQTKLDCAEDFFIEGPCAAIIECDGEQISINQIRWSEFFYDPRSRRHDFKDARYLGFAQWLHSDYVRSVYPEAATRLGDLMSVSGNETLFEETWGDKPEAAGRWVDRKTSRVLVVSLFYEKGGQWFRCVYTGAGVLEHDSTGYVDDKGRSLCPIEAESCYIDRDNMRYGRVRDMIPIQDEINARRSRLLHLANSRQLQERELGAAQVDADTARAEASRSDGVIPSGWQLVPVSDLAAGQQLLLQESKNEIERMGPTPAVLGRQEGANQSGRARLVKQQAGMTELARPMGRFSDWENRCYRQMWWRAQQFWTAPMWIRVTDETQAPEFIQINEPVMGTGIVPMMVNGQPFTDPNGQPVMTQGQVQVGSKNRITEMDMDIIIDTVPDTANLQQEVFADMLEVVRSGVDPFSPHFELLIEMSPIADKGRILERVKALREEQQGQGQLPPEVTQAIQQMQAQIAELTQGHEAVKAQKTQAETAKITAETAREYYDMGAGAGI